MSYLIIPNINLFTVLFGLVTILTNIIPVGFIWYIFSDATNKFLKIHREELIDNYYYDKDIMINQGAVTNKNLSILEYPWRCISKKNKHMVGLSAANMLGNFISVYDSEYGENFITININYLQFATGFLAAYLQFYDYFFQESFPLHEDYVNFDQDAADVVVLRNKRDYDEFFSDLLSRVEPNTVKTLFGEEVPVENSNKSCLRMVMAMSFNELSMIQESYREVVREIETQLS